MARSNGGRVGKDCHSSKKSRKHSIEKGSNSKRHRRSISSSCTDSTQTSCGSSPIRYRSRKGKKQGKSRTSRIDSPRYSLSKDHLNTKKYSRDRSSSLTRSDTNASSAINYRNERKRSKSHTPKIYHRSCSEQYRDERNRRKANYNRRSSSATSSSSLTSEKSIKSGHNKMHKHRSKSYSPCYKVKKKSVKRCKSKCRSSSREYSKGKRDEKGRKYTHGKISRSSFAKRELNTKCSYNEVFCKQPRIAVDGIDKKLLDMAKYGKKSDSPPTPDGKWGHSKFYEQTASQDFSKDSRGESHRGPAGGPDEENRHQWYRRNDDQSDEYFDERRKKRITISEEGIPDIWGDSPIAQKQDSDIEEKVEQEKAELKKLKKKLKKEKKKAKKKLKKMKKRKKNKRSGSSKESSSNSEDGQLQWVEKRRCQEN